jgi:hypothetical protein
LALKHASSGHFFYLIFTNGLRYQSLYEIRIFLIILPRYHKTVDFATFFQKIKYYGSTRGAMRRMVAAGGKKVVM